MCWVYVLLGCVLSACVGVLVMAALSARSWDDTWRIGYRAGRADEAAGLPPNPSEPSATRSTAPACAGRAPRVA